MKIIRQISLLLVLAAGVCIAPALESLSGTINLSAANESLEADFTDGLCEEDLDSFSVFAEEFGRSDCSSETPCESDYDGDGDVDAGELAMFATNDNQIRINSVEEDEILQGIREITASFIGFKTVEKVEFFVNGELLETVASEPYSVYWNTDAYAPLGHQLEAVAYLTCGQTVSDVKSVFVAVTPPEVVTEEVPFPPIPKSGLQWYDIVSIHKLPGGFSGQQYVAAVDTAWLNAVETADNTPFWFQYYKSFWDSSGTYIPDKLSHHIVENPLLNDCGGLHGWDWQDWYDYTRFVSFDENANYYIPSPGSEAQSVVTLLARYLEAEVRKPTENQTVQRGDTLRIEAYLKEIDGPRVRYITVQNMKVYHDGKVIVDHVRGTYNLETDDLPVGPNTLRFVLCDVTRCAPNVEVTIIVEPPPNPKPPVTSLNPPGASNFHTSIQVTVSATNDPTEIQYRINGGTWERYNVPITLNYTATIDAKAVNKDGWSNTVTGIYTKYQQPIPKPVTTIYPSSQTFRGGIQVTISATNNPTSIEYSLNGGSWQAYGAPLEIAETTTVQARATNAGGTGAVADQTYTKDKSKPPYHGEYFEGPFFDIRSCIAANYKTSGNADSWHFENHFRAKIGDLVPGYGMALGPNYWNPDIAATTYKFKMWLNEKVTLRDETPSTYEAAFWRTVHAGEVTKGGFAIVPTTRTKEENPYNPDFQWIFVLPAGTDVAVSDCWPGSPGCTDKVDEGGTVYLYDPPLSIALSEDARKLLEAQQKIDELKEKLEESTSGELDPFDREDARDALEVLFNHQISEQLIEDALLMVKGGASLKDINVSQTQIQIIQQYVDERSQKEATAYQKQVQQALRKLEQEAEIERLKQLIKSIEEAAYNYEMQPLAEETDPDIWTKPVQPLEDCSNPNSNCYVWQAGDPLDQLPDDYGKRKEQAVPIYDGPYYRSVSDEEWEAFEEKAISYERQFKATFSLKIGPWDVYYEYKDGLLYNRRGVFVDLVTGEHNFNLRPGFTPPDPGGVTKAIVKHLGVPIGVWATDDKKEIWIELALGELFGISADLEKERIYYYDGQPFPRY
jgi:CRISPR/Cas system CSM-associated protein Csm2 small subunit